MKDIETVDAIINGLCLLKVYGCGETWAEHDEFGFSGPPPDKLTKEERKKLKDWGWRWNDELTSWEIFT